MAASEMHYLVNNNKFKSNHFHLVEVILDFVYKIPIILMKSWKKNCFIFGIYITVLIVNF